MRLLRAYQAVNFIDLGMHARNLVVFQVIVVIELGIDDNVHIDIHHLVGGHGCADLWCEVVERCDLWWVVCIRLVILHEMLYRDSCEVVCLLTFEEEEENVVISYVHLHVLVCHVQERRS